jgi:hypothetical protein
MKNGSSTKNLFMTFFIVGAIFGLTFTALATWADLEASFYGFDRTGGERLGTLNCPIIMAKNETSTFSVRITNTSDRKIAPSVKTDVSTPAVLDTEFTPIKLEVGESKTLTWEITPENVDLDRFIFIRAWMYAGYPVKDKEGTCGVLVLPIPGKGIFYTWGMIIVSLLGMGVGLSMLKRSQNSSDRSTDFSRLVAMGVIALAGIIVSLLGIWLAGVLILVLGALLSVVLISHALRS